MSDNKQPTLEEILSGNSRTKKEPDWPEGDIREELKSRTDWNGLRVVVWIELGKEVLEYSLTGTLQKVRNLRKGGKEYWIKTGSEENPRILKCQGARIRRLNSLSGLGNSILEAMKQNRLEDEDKQSISPKTQERQLERAQKERGRYLERMHIEGGLFGNKSDRAYWERQPLDIPTPQGAKRNDPAEEMAAIQEIMIAYLEGNEMARRKDNTNSAFYEAGEIVDLSDSRMEQYYRRWREEQARKE